MTNLIENAIKYGRENGKVVVEFEEEKKNFHISIEDDGDQGFRQSIFSESSSVFIELTKVVREKQVVRGLFGNCEHILNAHKAKINVTSKIDKRHKI